MADTDATNITPLRPSPPVKDPTGAVRARRYRHKRKTVTAPVTGSENQKFEKRNDFKDSVTVARDAGVTAGKPSKSKAVTPSVQPPDQVRGQGVTVVTIAAALAL